MRGGFRMKKIFLTLILGMFLISLTSASISDLGVFKLNECVKLIQTCSDCTYNNITGISFPNSTLALSNEVEMTRDDTFYNYTFCNAVVTGKYDVNGFGDPAGIKTTWNYNFEITSFGTKVSNSGILYGVLLLIIFGMDLLIFFFIYTLGRENYRNEEGNFVGISLKKYVRAVLIGVSYGMILLTLNLMTATATSTSQISQFAGIIGGIFQAMLSVAWVWTICIIIWIAIMVWKDGNLIKEIEKRINESHHSLP